MGNWPAQHDLSCWQGHKTSTQQTKPVRIMSLVVSCPVPTYLLGLTELWKLWQRCLRFTVIHARHSCVMHFSSKLNKCLCDTNTVIASFSSWHNLLSQHEAYKRYIIVLSSFNSENGLLQVFHKLLDHSLIFYLIMHTKNGQHSLIIPSKSYIKSFPFNETDNIN